VQNGLMKQTSGLIFTKTLNFGFQSPQILDLTKEKRTNGKQKSP
jgi:hypothetical protein